MSDHRPFRPTLLPTERVHEAPTVETRPPLPAPGQKTPAGSGTAGVTDIHRNARRNMLNAAVWSLVDTERVEPDHDRLITLGARLGEVCDAWRFGHRDLDGELLKLAATALAFVETQRRGGAA